MAKLIAKACMPLSGYRQVVRLAKKPLEYLGFSLANVGASDVLKFDTGVSEWAVVILSGAVRAFGADGELTRGPLGSRKDVFSGKASALYLPPHFKGRIEAVTSTQLAVCQSLADTPTAGAPRLSGKGGMPTPPLRGHASGEGENMPSERRAGHATPDNGVVPESSGTPPAPVVITPEDVRTKTVGAHNWQRTVHDIVDQRIPAARLLVGETINQPGGWSSYPPHRHDEDRPPLEANLEEIYFFQVSPPQGFGFQRIYTDNRSLDESYAVENGDTVILPRGYHPVAAAPGYQVYYLWLMAGTGRVMCPFDDPQHAWVRGLEKVLKETA